MALGQNAVPPVNIPIPTKVDQNGRCTYPKMVQLILNHSHMLERESFRDGLLQPFHLLRSPGKKIKIIPVVIDPLSNQQGKEILTKWKNLGLMTPRKSPTARSRPPRHVTQPGDQGVLRRIWGQLAVSPVKDATSSRGSMPKVLFLGVTRCQETSKTHFRSSGERKKTQQQPDPPTN